MVDSYRFGLFDLKSTVLNLVTVFYGSGKAFHQEGGMIPVTSPRRKVIALIHLLPSN